MQKKKVLIMRPPPGTHTIHRQYDLHYSDHLFAHDLGYVYM